MHSLLGTSSTSRTAVRQGVLWVLVLVLALIVALWWPAAATAPSSALGGGLAAVPPGARGPVVIVDGRAGLQWQPLVTPTVTSVVSNTSSSPVTAEVWWLLAVEGDAQPWLHPVARSEAQTVDLLPGQDRQVRVLGESPAAPGTYGLSLWVHVRNADGTSTHSDGRQFASVVRVLPAHQGFERRGTTSSALTISDVARASSQEAGTILVTMTNASAEPHAVDLWAIARPLSRAVSTPLPPWEDPAAEQSARVSTVVAGASSAQIALQLPPGCTAWPVTPGGRPGGTTAELSVWAHGDRAGGRPHHSDGVWITGADCSVRPTAALRESP